MVAHTGSGRAGEPEAGHGGAVPDLHAYVDLSVHFGGMGAWAARHARGEVPDATPYGLHKLARHGVQPHFSPPLRNRAAAWLGLKVRNRLDQHDFVGAVAGAGRRDRRHADAVVCWDERNGVPAALVPGSPPVVSGAAWITDPARMPTALRRMTQLALPRMAGLLNFTEPMSAHLERTWKLPAGTVHRITFGVDAEFYTPRPPAERREVVVAVGDDRMRDHELLIRALDRVHRRGVPVQLELATLRDTAVPEHLGVVHRKRMEGAILPLYQRSSVVAVAVRPGPGGPGLTVMLEAMACARPVVITANPGFEEYVEHGVTGLLVPPDDEEAFADAVASLLRDPAAAAEMGRAARRSVERAFTTDHVAADLAKVLRSVA